MVPPVARTSFTGAQQCSHLLSHTAAQGILASETIFRLEDRKLKFETLMDMSASEIASLTRLNNVMGQRIVDCVVRFAERVVCGEKRLC